MPESKNRKRKIHIELTEETHQKLRVKAALHDLSLQAYVEELIANSVQDIDLAQIVRKATKDKELVGQI